jgi:hypothetical protein
VGLREDVHEVEESRIDIEDAIETFNEVTSERLEGVAEVAALADNAVCVLEFEVEQQCLHYDIADNADEVFDIVLIGGNFVEEGC